MDCINYEDCKAKLKSVLNKERYEHSLGTAECAKKLAKQYGLDEEKAYLAGLVHDCAKCLSNDCLKEQLKICKDLCEGESINHKTYHAPVGCIVAKKEYNIFDEEILSAIRWHTIGKSNMTDFEKIIFIADKIEPNTREVCHREPIEKALEEGGLDKALLVCYANTIKSLVDRNLKICVSTIEIYNELLEKFS